MSTPYFLESVDRVMKLLDCFTPAAPVLRLTDLSRRLGMTKTQVLRIASTLETGGYLTRDPETKQYRLGLHLFYLGMVVRQQMDLRRIAKPYLQHLMEATQETARLVVPDDLGPICLDLVESQRGIRVYAQLGARMPWHAGTSPKLLLAYLPDEQREQILARGGFERFTDRTVTNPDLLRQEVLAIRGQDWYVGQRDLDDDAIGVSAPIFDDHDRVVGAVNVSAPASRLNGAEVERFVHLVARAGREISRQLGHRGAPCTVADTSTGEQSPPPPS